MSDELPIAADGFACGWRRDAENGQHIAHMLKPFTFMAPSDVPEEIDHRAWDRTENQGQMGSCAGHAASDCAETCNFIGTGNVIQVSRMFCYLMGQKESGFFGRDQGAAISGCVGSLNRNGAPLEDQFPYPSRYTTSIPEEAIAQAKQHLIKSVSNLHNYDQIFAFLAMGVGAVEIGIDWTAGLASNRSGVIELSNCGGGSYGGHALCLNGYSRRVDAKGRKYLWMHNSHGESWGNKGWAEVSPDVIDRWTHGAGDGEFMGVSDMETYGQRYVDTTRFG